MSAPLVSIVTRTLGRPCLADAAAAVASQTWRPLEWVVVDAAGAGLVPPPAGDAIVRTVSTGERMLRSRALNAGLDAATGARALILDDDDLLLPHAVAHLAVALDAAPGHHLAYGDVLLDDGGPAPVGRFDFEYSELWITIRNLFPPNAALFDLAWLRERGIRLDETLDWFEDWDFWLAVSEHTRFLHLREFTAVYRGHLSQSGVATFDQPGADPRIREHGDRVAKRAARRYRPLRERHDAMKATARRLEADGKWSEAAAAWGTAHAEFHYDPEPLLRYAAIARRAGDVVAARSTLALGRHLMPDDDALARESDELEAALAASAGTPGDACAAGGTPRQGPR